MNDKKEERGIQAVREGSPPAARSWVAWSTVPIWVFLITAIVGFTWQFTLDRNPDTVRQALDLPAAESEIPGEVHTYTVVGDEDPEFISIDGDTTAIPIAPSKAETWGLPIGLAVLGVIGTVASSVLTSRGRIKELEGRLSTLETQRWDPQERIPAATAAT
jgi:hypothetical protein